MHITPNSDLKNPDKNAEEILGMRTLRNIYSALLAGTGFCPLTSLMDALPGGHVHHNAPEGVHIAKGSFMKYQKIAMSVVGIAAIAVPLMPTSAHASVPAPNRSSSAVVSPMNCIDNVTPSMYPKGEEFGPYKTYSIAESVGHTIIEAQGGSIKISREGSLYLDIWDGGGC